MRGLHFLEDFLQTVGNTPHEISANAAERIKPDLSSLVNKAYKAFLLAQSKLNKMNNALDNDLEETLVEEKNANDQIRESQVTLQQLKEKEKNLQGEVLKVEKQVARERVNLKEASAIAEIKENRLNESKKVGAGMVAGYALIGSLFGPVGALIGGAIATFHAAGIVIKATLAVEETSARKKRTEERLETKESDLTNVKTNLKESEKQERKKSEKLEMLESRKKEIKQIQKQLACLNEPVKKFITLMTTTESRTEMMAIEANGELPDIEAMMVPLMAIASDLSETAFTIENGLLYGHVDFKGIGSKIQKITSKTMKMLTSDDIDQWA